MLWREICEKNESWDQISFDKCPGKFLQSLDWYVWQIPLRTRIYLINILVAMVQAHSESITYLIQTCDKCIWSSTFDNTSGTQKFDKTVKIVF